MGLNTSGDSICTHFLNHSTNGYPASKQYRCLSYNHFCICFDPIRTARIVPRNSLPLFEFYTILLLRLIYFKLFQIPCNSTMIRWSILIFHGFRAFFGLIAQLIEIFFKFGKKRVLSGDRELQKLHIMSEISTYGLAWL